MQGLGTITTQGQGVNTLRKYFELFHSSLPAKLPASVREWGEEVNYEAPHGFLTVWDGGYWEVTFTLNSVAADIQTIPCVTISAT